MRYTTPHSLFMIHGFRPKKSGLQGFYEWANKIGHWRICAAIERWRIM